MNLRIPFRNWWAPWAVLLSVAMAGDLWVGPWVAEGLDPAAWVWNGSLGGEARVENGRLLLKPKDDAWGRFVLSTVARRWFWNGTGATLTVQGELRTLKATEGGDFTAFFGFTADGDARMLQSGQNFVGFSVNRATGRGEVEVALSVKEAAGSVLNHRGDDKGNLSYFRYPAEKFPVAKADGPFTATLTLTAKKLVVDIPKWGFHQEVDHGLTESLWAAGARVFLQGMHLGTGRGMVVLDRLTWETPSPRPEDFSPVDLAPFANMGFKDEVAGDGKGGWTDQGVNDLSRIPVGPMSLSGLPFQIIDPVKNNGKGAVLLYSDEKPFFPKVLGPIAVMARAKGFLFLHAAAWAKDGALAATCDVQYEDGTSLPIPITVGEHVGDWWTMKPVTSDRAKVLLTVKSAESAKGIVGLYGYHWVNPHPEKKIASLKLISAGGKVVYGLVAVTRVADTVDGAGLTALARAFSTEIAVDTRKNPPDRDVFLDKVQVKSENDLSQAVFSVAGYYRSAASSFTREPDLWAELVKKSGGMVRFPYGLEISFSFWPFEVNAWAPVLAAKGGQYGAIQSWFHKYGDKSNLITIPQMLATAKAQGLKVILQLNVHSMFDGKDFLYVKSLPEERMKRENPLDSGVFDEAVMTRIVARNRDLVDFVVKQGYGNTVAWWEMDNERWDMKGSEYARCVAENTRMLRSRLPGAKVVVCLGDLSAWTPNPEGHYYLKWSHGVLEGLAKAGLAGAIDAFAPHLYPFLSDTTNDLPANYLEDWAIRNVTRSLDTLSAMLDQTGFKSSRFLVSEWGAQSDGVASASRNDLLSGMAGALATAKTMMAIYAHPRVLGATFHPFIHDSYVSRTENRPIKKWGCQSVFYLADQKTYLTTHLLEAVQAFTEFSKSTTLIPLSIPVPAGVQVLSGRDPKGVKYFAVNSTGKSVTLPLGVRGGRTLSGDPNSGVIKKYGSFGDKPGDIEPVVWKDVMGSELPPYSIRILR